MHRMKKLHEDELAVLRAEKKELRERVQSGDDRLVEMKKEFEEEIKRREQKIKSEHAVVENDKEKELLKELYDKNEKVETENIKLQKQVEHLARENRAMAG